MWYLTIPLFDSTQRVFIDRNFLAIRSTVDPRAINLFYDFLNLDSFDKELSVGIYDVDFQRFERYGGLSKLKNPCIEFSLPIYRLIDDPERPLIFSGDLYLEIEGEKRSQGVTSKNRLRDIHSLLGQCNIVIDDLDERSITASVTNGSPMPHILFDLLNSSKLFTLIRFKNNMDSFE